MPNQDWNPGLGFPNVELPSARRGLRTRFTVFPKQFPGLPSQRPRLPSPQASSCTASWDLGAENPAELLGCPIGCLSSHPEQFASSVWVLVSLSVRWVIVSVCALPQAAGNLVGKTQSGGSESFPVACGISILRVAHLWGKAEQLQSSPDKGWGFQSTPPFLHPHPPQA